MENYENDYENYENYYENYAAARWHQKMCLMNSLLSEIQFDDVYHIST